MFRPFAALTIPIPFAAPLQFHHEPLFEKLVKNWSRKTKKFLEHRIGIQWFHNYVLLGLWPQSIITNSLHICDHYTSKAQRLLHYNSHKPEELVEVSVFHVLEDHDKRISIYTDAVELHYVIVLKVGQQLGLPLEIWPRRKGGILQGLRRHIRRPVYSLTKTPRN